MTDTIQESLYKGMQVGINRTIEKLALDKTVIAVVKSCDNGETRKYTVEYNGGKMPAYAEENKAYNNGDSVYVLVPEGNFKNKKIIISKAYATDDAVAVYSIDDNYNYASDNMIYENDINYFPAEYSYTEIELYNYNSDTNKINIDVDNIINTIVNSDAMRFSAQFYTMYLTKEFRQSYGHYGLKIYVRYTDTDELFSYIFDSNKNMTGNPLLYISWIEQYEYYSSIQTKNIERIEKITFYSEGFPEYPFVETNNTNKIGIKNISLYGMKEIPSNGDYKLRVSCGDGFVFQDDESKEMTIYAKLLYKNLSTLEDAANYYWFVENPKITINSKEYSSVGGLGWELINDKNVKNITIYRKDIIGYNKKYKCVCRYGSDDPIELVYNFKVYNKSSSYMIQVDASPAQITIGTSIVKCEVYQHGMSSVMAQQYNYIWKIYGSNGDETIIENTNNTYECAADSIDSYVTVQCSVYLDKDFIGSDSVTITKGDSQYYESYYVVIDNLNQLFQYNEFGISPCAQSTKNPIEVKTLMCHLYYKDGEEIKFDNYTVKWSIPATKTLLVAGENDTLQTYIFDIADDYNREYIDNQITCYITYNGQVYSAKTNFSFLKVGDNGTNGTEYSVKFLGDAVLTNRESINLYNKLQPTLYCRNSIVQPTFYQWSISGVTSNKCKISDINNNVLKYNNNQSWNTTRLVIRYAADGKHYGFYPMPLVEYKNGASETVSINTKKILKEVIYTSTGDFPIYDNKNHNFNEAVKVDGKYNKLEWTAHGEISISNGVITPNSHYNGSTNNYVQTTIEGVATVYIPIYMHYNTYELASLNGWDGNSVEINDDGYVLAPQVGAGEKKSDNTFTGILMGTQRSQADENKNDVGLFGYSSGKRSIFLDANTGAASFGLPETGKIILDPRENYDSNIGSWVFGEDYLYNALDEAGNPVHITTTKEYGPTDKHGDIPHDAYGVMLSADDPYVSVKGKKWTSQASSVINPGNSFELELDPNNETLFNIWRHCKYNEHPRFDKDKYYKIGDVVTKEENNTIQAYEAIDTHGAGDDWNNNKWELVSDPEAWHRIKSVYIDRDGRFMVNGVAAGGASLGLSSIKAFEDFNNTTDGTYKGMSVEISDDGDVYPFFRVFVKDNLDGRKDSTVHITGASHRTDEESKAINEYTRPIAIHGKSISLYAANSGTSATTDNYISLSSSGVSIGGDVTVFGNITASDEIYVGETTNNPVYGKNHHLSWGTSLPTNTNFSYPGGTPPQNGDIYIKIV